MSRVFDVALFAQLLEPGEPFLHGFLHFLGGLRRRLAATKQKGKFAHCVSSRVGTSHPRRLSEAAPDIFFWSRPRVARLCQDALQAARPAKWGLRRIKRRKTIRPS